MRRTLLMVAGAVALLLALGFADPDNSRLMPSLFSNELQVGVISRGSLDEIAIVAAISAFNREIALAHREQNSARLNALAMDEGIRRHAAEDIEFLRRDGRLLDMAVKDIRITQMRRLEDQSLSVNTAEAVTIRYLKIADRSEIAAYPATPYAMNYTLAREGDGWKIAAVETMQAGARGN